MSDKKLKRDEHNMLDKDSAREETEKLMRKLITEERMHQKHISFNHARGNKRDIMVYITIFARNSVDGMIVLGDDDRGYQPLDGSGRDPYKYKDLDIIEFPLLANQMPVSKIDLSQAIRGCFTALVSKMISIGAVNS